MFQTINPRRNEDEKGMGIFVMKRKNVYVARGFETFECKKWMKWGVNEYVLLGSV